MMNSAPRYVFGPVLSRRLGRSLGIDLIPPKTCAYDCVYCQCGRTTLHTLERRDYVPIATVLEEIDARLATGVAPDYITLAGSGEPTLHSGLGDFLRACKARYAIPLAVITNGSLLWDPEVRAELAAADLVIPSLDAASETVFALVNRPVTGLALTDIIAGLEVFRMEYTGLIWLEVLLLAGVSDTEKEVLAIADVVRRVKPDRLHLTTAVRPSAAGIARAISPERLREVALLFDVPVEIIGPPIPSANKVDAQSNTADAYGLLQRHPCSIDEIAAGLGIDPNHAIQCARELLDADLIRTSIREGVVIYIANPKGNDV